MANAISPLEEARRKKRADELQAEEARLKQKVKDADDRLEKLNGELTQIPAPDEPEAKRNLRKVMWIFAFSLLLCIGFMFFAELSLRAIGFDWHPVKMYFAAFVFWLATVVTMHIYLSWFGAADFRDLPWFIGWAPFALIILGVLVLALARGLLSLLPTNPEGMSEFLAGLQQVAKWSGLISQLVLSLGMDLGSGVLAFVGVRKYDSARPVWDRYKEIRYLANHRSTWSDRIASLEAELTSSGYKTSPDK